MTKVSSPLRYPGGKGQFYEKVVSIMEFNDLISKKTTYVEPFCGGAGVALKLLLNSKVDEIILNDFDRSIYAFWYSILNFTDKFCEKIMNSEISIEEYYKQKEIQKEKETVDLFELGFSTFFLNRTNRSGIITAGPIGGYSQNGKWKLNVRFNKISLVDKIKEIAKYKNKIKIYNLEALKFLQKSFFKNQKKNYFIFFDPPYFNKGKDLYFNFFKPEQHYLLANFIKTNFSNQKWIITYDICDDIKRAYSDVQKEKFNIRYSLQNKKEAQEFLFYNNILLPENLF